MSRILDVPNEALPPVGEPVIVDIQRYNPSVDPAPHVKRYIVPYRQRMSILTLLRNIYESIDPSLAFRNQQCNQGICNLCQVSIGVDGEHVKACKVSVQPGSHVTIAPSHPDRVIRDLVIDT